MKGHPGERIRVSMLKKGVKSGADVARRAKIRESTFNAYLNGTRNPPLDACMRIGNVLSVSGQWLFNAEGSADAMDAQRQQARLQTQASDRDERALPFIPVLGRVAAGLWSEVEPLEQNIASFKPSLFPPDPRYPVEAQFDLVVEGSSLDRFAQDGQFLRCVNLIRSGVEIHDGDLVIVERTRETALRETTAKRVRHRGGRVELWPHSNDSRYQEPIVVPDGGEDQQDEVRITALVLYAYTPAIRM